MSGVRGIRTGRSAAKKSAGVVAAEGARRAMARTVRASGGRAGRGQVDRQKQRCVHEQLLAQQKLCVHRLVLVVVAKGQQQPLCLRGVRGVLVVVPLNLCG